MCKIWEELVMRWKCRIARLVRTLRWNALIARWITPALPPVLHSHHPGSLIMVGEVEVRRSVGRKVKPDIDFYPGDGGEQGEQGQPGKGLISPALPLWWEIFAMHTKFLVFGVKKSNQMVFAVKYIRISSDAGCSLRLPVSQEHCRVERLINSGLSVYPVIFWQLHS